MLVDAANAKTVDLLTDSNLSHILKQESWRKELYRPQYHLHKWWARRLGTSTRLLIISALSDFKIDELSCLYRNYNFSGKVVLDPFMGSGTTIGEAIKLGCNTIGNDINPVSEFIVRTTIESIGLIGFIEEAENEIKKLAKRFEDFYKTKDNHDVSRTVDHYFWRMTDECDYCRSNNIITSTNIISRHAYPKKFPRIHTICPSCQSINTGKHGEEYSHCSTCSHVYENSSGNSGKRHFRCRHCGKNNSLTPRHSKPRYSMVAIRYRNPDGAVVFKKPDKHDIDNYESQLERRDKIHFDEQIIPNGDTTQQILNFGYQTWTDLFNARQLVVIDALIKSIDNISAKNRDLYSILISTALENYCKLTSYKGEGTGAVRGGFSRQVYYAEKQYIENNIFGAKENSGSLLSILHHRFKRFFEYSKEPFELSFEDGKFTKVVLKEIKRPKTTKSYLEFQNIDSLKSLIMRGDAGSLKIPDSSVDAVITDPPYFDMIDYSELADFFYYWLRQMGASAEDMSNDTSVSEYDIHGSNLPDFSRKMTKAFGEMSRVLKDKHYLVFSFQHRDSKVWKSLKKSLKDSNFEIIATPLVHAENEIGLSKSKTDPIRFDVIIVCQNNKNKTGEISRKHYHKDDASALLNESEKMMLDNAIYMLE